MDNPKERVRRRIDTEASSLIRLSHTIHGHPELAYAEVRSSALLAGALEEAGLNVERGAYGLETAFRATAGHRPLPGALRGASGGLHIVICAEYDALPGIGHACGHNIIGASSVGAGLALSEVAEDLGIRVTILGTPAEERGGGKIDLINAGAFDDADLAMMVHPGPMEVVDLPTLAWASLEITYHGKESHASMAPHRGLNALDAMNISYVAVAALRQHIRQTERIHGIITHGGDAPNIVPKLTTAAYFVRAANSEELQLLKERVVRCFEAGALATGCDLEVSWLVKDYEFMRMNPTIGAVYEANLETTGRSAIPRQVVGNQAASTDMGNVSHLVPSIHPMMSIDSLPAVNHQVEFAAASVSPAGDRAVVDAALVLASTAVDIATTPGAVDRLREEFAHPAADTSLRL
jgi:amidohydrolase